MSYKHLLVGAALALAPLAGAQATVLLGTEITVSYYFPDLATEYPFATPAPATFPVGAGVESIVDVEGVTWLSIDFSDKALSIAFDTTLSGPIWTLRDFNGLVFTGEGISKLTGAAIGAGTTFPGFPSPVFELSRVNIAGDTLTINLAGISYDSDSRIDLTFQAVPEPATWAMMIAGFGLVGFAARRRKTLATA